MQLLKFRLHQVIGIHMKLVVLFILLGVSFVGVSQKKTHFKDTSGEFANLLHALEKNLFTDRELDTATLGGKQRTIFVPWIRDHVHVLKAMKYLHPDVNSFLEFYLENQTEEGLYFDYFFPLGWGGEGTRKKIFHPRYWKEFPGENIEMHRLPVEADLEYLMVEGVYAVYQSTGDTAFVRKWLPALVKGMHYSMRDPLRWSSRHQLVKRGYTLDTWDFMQLPASREEYTRNGGNVQKGIFDIDDETPMGIMHGDNSGMYYASVLLSKMFEATGDKKNSEYWIGIADHFRTRTNALCWNGKFYAHFVEDDPQPAYLKMDQRNTLSLSNPYDINRGLPTESMAQSIIATYLSLKEKNKLNSFAEWFGVYPPVEPHFADYKPGSYMNGGVNTIVAGELAKAAFQNGFESYGIDILKRLHALIKSHKGKLPVAYTPDGTVDEGIPDNWGQAAVYSAMIEGLAGIVDLSTRFRHIQLSPRWIAGGEKSASVSVTYAPVGDAVTYSYSHHPAERRIRIAAQGPMLSTQFRILLPVSAVSAHNVTVNGKSIAFRMEKIRESMYVVLESIPGNQIEVIVAYK